MAAKPIVDGIEERHAADLIVIRLNLQDPAGAALADRYGFRVTPTFILFAADGEEVWRQIGAIDPRRVDEYLAVP
jgi:thioredoxin-related protein